MRLRASAAFPFDAPAAPSLRGHLRCFPMVIMHLFCLFGSLRHTRSLIWCSIYRARLVLAL